MSVHVTVEPLPLLVSTWLVVPFDELADNLPVNASAVNVPTVVIFG